MNSPRLIAQRKLMQRDDFAETLGHGIETHRDIVALCERRVQRRSFSQRLCSTFNTLPRPRKALAKTISAGSADDVHHGQRRHRRIGKFAHVVVHRDRQGLRALRGDEERSREFIERQNCGKQPAADQARQQQRQRDGRQHPMRWRAEAGRRQAHSVDRDCVTTRRRCAARRAARARHGTRSPHV